MVSIDYFGRDKRNISEATVVRCVSRHYLRLRGSNECCVPGKLTGASSEESSPPPQPPRGYQTLQVSWRTRDVNGTFNEISQLLEKAPTRAFYRLKALTIKNLLKTL